MNVVKDLRQQAGLTQQQLAKLAGVTTLYVIRAEQFLHPNLDKLSRVLASVNGQDSQDSMTAHQIEDTYVAQREDHVSRTRALFYDDPRHESRVARALDYALNEFTPPVGLLREERQKLHPFTLFREYLFDQYELPTSQIKFAAYTGVHPAALSALENSYSTIETDSPVAKMLTNTLLLDVNQLALLQVMCDRCL